MVQIMVRFLFVLGIIMAAVPLQVLFKNKSIPPITKFLGAFILSFLISVLIFIALLLNVF